MAEILSSDSSEFFTLLNANTVADSISDHINVARQRHFTFQTYSASGTPSLTVQVSLQLTNPTRWADLGTMSGNDLRQAEGQFSWIRVVRDAGVDPITCYLRRGMYE